MRIATTEKKCGLLSSLCGNWNKKLPQNFLHKIVFQRKRGVAQLGNIKIDWEKGDGRAT